MGVGAGGEAISTKDVGATIRCFVQIACTANKPQHKSPGCYGVYI